MVANAAETPVTTPALVIVAIAVDKLLQVPPTAPVTSVNVICAPEHTLSKPVIAPAFGKGFTVTACVAVALPQLNVDEV